MIKEYFSAAELAGIVGLPTTDRAIQIRAKREEWKSRKRESRGGGSEYHITALPKETQKAIHKSNAFSAAAKRAKTAQKEHETKQTSEHSAELDASIIEFTDHLKTEDEKQLKARLKLREQGMVEYVGLPAHKKKSAEAKLYILHNCQQFIEEHRLNKTQGIAMYCLAIKDKEITLPDYAHAALPRRHGKAGLDVATFNRWKKRFKEKGRMGLVDNFGNRKGQSKIASNPELVKVVFGALMNYPHITAKKIKAYLEADKPELNIVGSKSIERFINNWKQENAQLWCFMSNPDKWKNSYMSAAGSHFERIERLNQLWEMDSTPGDWMLTDGRHSVLGVIDLYSRRLKLYVSKTSKAMAVCEVFRRSVIDWGVCEVVRTDNGKDYISNQFKDVITDLEIEQELCVPFASEEKGTIERALQTMSHGILDLLPGFIGHNVAERKVIESRKSFAQRIMTPEETVEVTISSEKLQEILDQWADHIYAHDVHGGLNGKTPWQVASEWTGTVRRISDERALDMLLAEVAGKRTITKKGIRFNDRYYFDQAIFERVGEKVTIKYDERDLGRLATYINGEFICWSVNHELTGTSRQEAAVATKAHQKKFLNLQTKDYKKYKRELNVDLPQVVLQHRIEQSQKLAALPKPAEEYSTNGLTAAGHAAGNRQTETQELDDKTKALQQQIADELKKPIIKSINENESIKERYARWARVEKQIEQNEPVAEELKQQLERYKKSGEYRSMKEFFEENDLPIGEVN